MNTVFLNPKKDLADCKAKIAEIRDWKSRNWAIGLTYEGNHQPDGFFLFWAKRGLPFQAYLVAPDLQTGDPAAYDANVETLSAYAQKVHAAEVKAVKQQIAEIRDWQKKFWAIGLTYESCQPDGFATFMKLRNLHASYFVSGGACTYGADSAYDTMVQALERYRDSLWDGVV